MINQGSLQTIETNGQAGYSVAAVGGVPFVFPCDAVLTPDQLSSLHSAATLAGLGRRKVAEAIVQQVQRDLGVSQELYVLGAAAAAERLANAQRRERVARGLSARGKAVVAVRAVAEPEASRAVKAAVREAEDAAWGLRRARADLQDLRTGVARLREAGRGIPQWVRIQRDAARAGMLQAWARFREATHVADTMRRAQLAEWWAERAEAETARQAEARGETLVRIQESELRHAIRISSRDGLAMLYESGKISRHAYGAGRAYRVAYEAAGADLRIASLNPAGGAGRVTASLATHRSAAELQRAYVLARLRQIELAVGAVGARELRVLRAVAGEGHTISSLGRAGSARARNTAALEAALEAAVRVLAGGVQRGLKRAAST